MASDDKILKRRKPNLSGSAQAPVKDKQSPKKQSSDDSKEESKARDPKFGNLGIKHEHRVLSRFVLLAGIFVVVGVTQWRKTKESKEVTFIAHEDVHSLKGLEVVCDEAYRAEVNTFEGCVPKKCGRLVMDGLVSSNEVALMAGIVKKGLQFGRSSGGASILDLHSGALSKGQNFVNIYSLPETRDLWTAQEFQTYVSAKERIKSAISANFGINPASLFLASPTFFSEITSKEAATLHDEYWHPHVDKETYESFHFTSLLYLTDYGVDFEGGRFIFVDKDGLNRTIEPRKGRVSVFTSGPENLHFVEKVRSGVRYAVTIAFTCDPSKAIADPQINKK